MRSTLYALAAVALWASLATLGVALRQMPPLLLTGLALMVGSVPCWPWMLRQCALWRLPWSTWLLGAGTLFGYHFALFMALRWAPPVEVNLINYLWPLLIVLLAPVYLPGVRWSMAKLLAGLMGFAGAGVAILGGATTEVTVGASWPGYALAALAAVLWSNYSLQSKRLSLLGRAFPTVAIGAFGLVAGALSVIGHVVLEPTFALTKNDALLVMLIGLGPLGLAFLLWDQALKLGDAQWVGLLSYLTPLGSTLLLMLFTGRAWQPSVLLSAALIIGAGALGSRTNAKGRS